MQVLGWAKEIWAIPGKMIYPNDPLLLVFGCKTIGDPEDFAEKFGSECDHVYMLGTSDVWADLVDACLRAEWEPGDEPKNGCR